MIVGSRFDGDNDHQTMSMQHDSYGRAIWIIALRCRDSYLASGRIIGHHGEYKEKLVELKNFDHRILQDVHDHLAAYYRLKFRFFHPVFPAFLEKERAQSAWLDWLRSEVASWPDLHPDWVRAVCKILSHENTETGYLAEDLLIEALRNAYPLHRPLKLGLTP